MQRAYVSIDTRGLAGKTDDELLGKIAGGLTFAVEPAQRAAWKFQLQHLRALAADLPPPHFFLEFLIPRMGRRADLVVVLGGLIFVVEYKVRSDLRHFAESWAKNTGKSVVGFAPHSGRSGSYREYLKADRQLCSGN